MRTTLPTHLLAVLAAIVLATATARADRMKDNDYFTMSNKGDHLHFKLQMADAWSLNTYCDWGGILCSDGTSNTEIIILYSGDGDDDGDNWKIYAMDRNGQNWGGQSFITNIYPSGESKIEFRNGDSGTAYTIRKKDLYPQVEIDFYWPPSMAGKTWKFTYQFNHVKNSGKDGGWQTMQLGSTYLGRNPQDMGYSETSTSQFDISRERMDKLQLTVPQLPGDIPSRLADNRHHETTYKLTMTYTMPSGQKVTRTSDDLKCESAGKKTYDIDIPAEVQKYKRLDIEVATTDKLVSHNGQVFWNIQRSYAPYAKFPNAPQPAGLTAEYRQFDSEAYLAWEAFGSGDSYLQASESHVYRIETNATGTPLSGQSWQKRGSLGEVGTSQHQSYTDQQLSSGKYYRYMVLSVPKAWVDKGVSSSDLNSPSSDLLARLPYVESDVVSTAPQMSIYDLRQDTSVTDKVRLTWQYSRVPVTSQNVTFQVLRRTSANAEWEAYGTATAAANPGAGDVCSFTDTNLPNNRVRYDYKVALELNGGTNRFESDAVTAGFLSGTLVNGIEATKGSHEKTVRVTWRAKQVGTANSSYVLSRRYADSTDDFQQIYTTNGTAEQYVYEDNTVMPGYYYEYKVDVYGGDDGTHQNVLTDIGFCQARGVVSGAVTFGSGSAVKGVRVNLIAATDASDAVRGYSKRIDGASTGIQWEADETERAKLFGSDRDLTVQMFVRPDKGLSEGAVIAEIPGVGRLYAGPLTDGGYKLYCRQTTVNRTTTTYTKANVIRAIAHETESDADTHVNEENKVTVYSSSAHTSLTKSWKDNNFMLMREYATSWYGTGVNTDVFQRVADLKTPVNLVTEEMEYAHYDMGVALRPELYSLLTLNVVGGNISAAVGDSAAAERKLLRRETPQAVATVPQLPEGYLLHNGNLVTFEGNVFEALQSTGWMWTGWVSTTTPTETQTTGIELAPFSVGGAEGITAEQAFRGNVTEVRVFDHALTAAERTSYADRTLNGRENGLRLYWPMDEGLKRNVFDASYANDVPNSRHATVGSNVTTSVIVPTQAQLSRYGLTNEQGEYIIRGIPFAGSGTGYRLVPELGIHEFSPNTRSMFIAPTSLTANNVDFFDASSFPMEGYVYYAGTNVPVKDIQFYIDGELVTGQGEIKKTNDNGRYTISVPIGEHYVEARLDGHTMAARGRFPTTGTFNFDRAVQHNFSDSTLVNFVGRVGGGERNDTLAVGFGQSRNNIGMATVQLRLNNETFSFNCGDDYSSPAATTRTWQSDTTTIKSRAWTLAGVESKYINIRTDSLTGEFSALLPPLKYAIKGVEVDNNPDIEFISGEEVDLTSVRKELTDSMWVVRHEGDSTFMRYTYNTKKVFTHFARPQLDIVEHDHDRGAYGLKKLENYVIDYGTSRDTITIDNLWKPNADGGIDYLMGYPIYQMDDSTRYDLFAYEAYVNRDDPTTHVHDTIPLRGQIVTITNEMSSDQKVVAYVKNPESDVQPGEIINLKEDQVRLGTDGRATYSWHIGAPNIVSPFTRHFSTSFVRNGRTYLGQELDAVVLGFLIDGNNFVTKGPDDVKFVLRDPPGSKSTTKLKKGHVSVKETYDAANGYGDYKLVLNHQWGIETEVGAGIGLMAISGNKHVAELNTGLHSTWENQRSHERLTTTTITETFSTSAAYPYFGSKGDVYVGNSSNLLVGSCRDLHITRSSPTSPFTFELSDALSLGKEISTTFIYTQYELETVMIPKWKDLRQKYLTEVASKAAADAFVNNGNRPVYLTWLKPDDLNYGCEGYYRYVKPQDTSKITDTERDSVEWCTQQIQHWENIIAQNEEDKVKSMATRSAKAGWVNYSIDGGSSYTYTTRNDTTDIWRTKTTWKVGGIVGGGSTIHFKAAASYLMVFNINTETGGGHADGSGTNEQNYTEWEYTLNDGNYDTDLSIDKFDSGRSGFSPVFSIFGGQTYNPWEPQELTHYYQKGTPLGNSTVRMEQPRMRVSAGGSNPSQEITVTDIPSGQELNLTLHCTNMANVHQGVNFNYNLVIVEQTNDKGLEILMDGVPISGRSIRIPQSETVTKQITIRQTDQSILDYEGVVLRFCSQYEPLLIKDEVTINAHFVPSSSPINLAAEEPILNQETLARSGGNLVLKLTGFNRLFKNLKNIGVQYRYAGNPQWNTIHTYVTNKADSLDTSYSLLPEAGTLRYTHNMLDDMAYPQGTYTFRAFTTTPYGNNPNDAATVYSPEVTVVKDNISPRALTTPTPFNGILTYGGDLSVEFNEDIVPGYVSDKNIIVTAKLNRQEVAHEVSMEFSRRGATATTQSPIFINGDFSIDFWLNWAGGNNILTQGSGASTFTLRLDADGHVIVTIGGSDYTSTGVIPHNTWTYLVMSYRSADRTFSMLAQHGTTSVNLFSEQAVSQRDIEQINYISDNHLRIGGFDGKIHSLSLFNIYRDVHEAAATRSVTKDNYLYGLAHHWPMNEGHGNVAADTRHVNNILTSQNLWHIDGNNYSVRLDSNEGMSASIADINTTQGESYAVECWVRANSAGTHPEQVVFATGSTKANRLRLYYDNKLSLKLDYGTHTRTLATMDEIPSPYAYHHMALNVVRGQAASFYIDGQRTAVIAETDVPPLVGATIEAAKDVAFFDELRIWHAAISESRLQAGIYNCIDTAEVYARGLVAYYPFEKTAIEAGASTKVFTLENMAPRGKRTMPNAPMTIHAQYAQNNSTPPLKSAPEEVRIAASPVASERKVVVNLTSTTVSARDLEGTTLNITLADIRDQHGNASQPIKWTAFVKRNTLMWARDSVNVNTLYGEGATFDVKIENWGGTTEYYTLQYMPTWLTLVGSSTDEELAPLTTRTLRFRVEPLTAIGTYDATIALEGNNGIAEPLRIVLKVSGKRPEWDVDPTLYEHHMTIVGQVLVDGFLLENEESLVAAFIGNECRGVASPEKVREAAFVTLNVFGDDYDDLDSGKEITFRLWDATKGVAYTDVAIYTPKEGTIETKPTELTFSHDALIGSFDSPAYFRKSDYVEQLIPIHRNWNWIALGVTPKQTYLDRIFPALDTWNVIIKDQGAHAAWSNGAQWKGNLSVEANTMYKMKVEYKATTTTELPAALSVSGQQVKLIETPVSLRKGWNWIGYTPLTTMSIGEALAAANPQKGDRVKSQTGLAIYSGTKWEGNLKALESGRGYMYYSTDTVKTKMFLYPTPTQNLAPQRAPLRAADAPLQYFTAVDPYLYSDNMTMVVELRDGEAVVDTCEVAVFIDDECRAATRATDGLYYLIIAGEGSGQSMELRSFMRNKVRVIDDTQKYVSDGNIGTPWEPYVIDVSAYATGISGDGATPTDDTWYTIDGIKLAEKPKRKGVYIHNGKKVSL